MESLEISLDQAAAVAAALQRLDPTPPAPTKLPAIRGELVAPVTKKLAKACLATSTPFVLALANAIVSGDIELEPGDGPAFEAKPKGAKIEKAKPKKVKAKKKAKAKPRKKARRR